MSSVVDTDRGALELRVGPFFGSEEVGVLHHALEQAEPGTRVEVDFHDVRDFDPAALGLLAQEIRAGRSRIGLHGVSRHLARVLRYLGVDAGPRDRAGDAG
jgi:anti-anti-sigma regulatory factor